MSGRYPINVMDNTRLALALRRARSGGGAVDRRRRIVDGLADVWASLPDGIAFGLFMAGILTLWIVTA